MSHKPSGIYCDLCSKPLFGKEEYWYITVNDKNGHSCKPCRDKHLSLKDQNN